MKYCGHLLQCSAVQCSEVYYSALHFIAVHCSSVQCVAERNAGRWRINSELNGEENEKNCIW